jgi:LmbE family N-acetylglucosaminyl deacetylase
MDTAIAALQAHASQVGEDVAKHMRNWRSRTGSKVGFAYAEGFKRFHLE